eukprot:GDKJ01058521.1.p1 GENE.GDKJ01058521.1~~GDKJ01058521.1.p1  ORF type:complete len:268 (+),score=16.60 GDKJ01058521.1:42-845(+)
MFRLFIVLVLFALISCISMKRRGTPRTEKDWIDTEPMLVTVNVKAKCSRPHKFNAQRMGIKTPEQAEKLCRTWDKCLFYSWDALGTNEITLCSSEEWYDPSFHVGGIIGVHIKSNYLNKSGWFTRSNKIAYCEGPNLIAERQGITNVHDGISICESIPGCSFFTMNSALGLGMPGPTIGSYTSYFCRGQPREVPQNGFLVIAKIPKNPVSDGPLVKAPCGSAGAVLDAPLLPLEEGSIASPGAFAPGFAPAWNDENKKNKLKGKKTF